jgi:enoyl-CoA hydratase/carnithine racemase
MSENTPIDGQVRLERRGHVAIVTLDRTERRNAMNQAMWSGLERAVTELERSLPRVVVVTGAGDKAFCAGMDVNPDNPDTAALMTAMQAKDPAPVVAMLTRMRGVLDRLVGLPVPVIAAVNGVAFGGGAEMAVRCDLRVMDPAATIAFSEVRLGLMPDWGGGVALTRVVGRARAADLILTARRVAADEAQSLGLVNRVSAPSACLAEAKALAETIAHNGPRAVRATLRLIRHIDGIGDTGALALELDQAAKLIASGECVFGVGAFLSRTTPSFPDPEDGP